MSSNKTWIPRITAELGKQVAKELTEIARERNVKTLGDFLKIIDDDNPELAKAVANLALHSKDSYMVAYVAVVVYKTIESGLAGQMGMIGIPGDYKN